MRDGTAAAAEASIDQRIAVRVRSLRAELGLSLEALSSASGVSRSMISLIERGESSPTAVVLDKLGRGLGVTLAELLASENRSSRASPSAPPSPLVRREEQLSWQDPASGYVRRALSPPELRQPLQLTEVVFPARAHVTFENGGVDRSLFQQVWMLEGAMEIANGDARHTLREGDCLAMDLTQPTSFHNHTRKPARYLVALAHLGKERGNERAKEKA